MYYGGLLGYELPKWGFSRWERLEADTFAAFSEKELAGIDEMNRAFRSIIEYYGSLVTLTDSDKAELNKNMSGRFWGNDLARMRYPIYTKLAPRCSRSLALPRRWGSDILGSGHDVYFDFGGVGQDDAGAALGALKIQVKILFAQPQRAQLKGMHPVRQRRALSVSLWCSASGTNPSIELKSRNGAPAAQDWGEQATG